METTKQHLEAIKVIEVDIEQGLLFQTGNKVKRWQIACSLFHFGYSELQVSKIMKVNVRTAHAFKIRTDKEAKAHKAETGDRLRCELKNYLKGGIELVKDLLNNCSQLVGDPSQMLTTGTIKKEGMTSKRTRKAIRKQELKQLFEACTQ